MTSLRSNEAFVSVSLLVLYAFSGLVALAYEVLWMRMLSLQFGVSNFGVVITVSAFMLGLGLGSVLGRKLLYRLPSPLLVLGLIELAVAAYALLLPTINAQWVNVLLSSQGDVGLVVWHSMEVVAALFFLLLPATALGAGFPLILAVIKNSPLSLSHLYAANTLGAALGALLPLLLLPVFGWVNSLYFVAAIGIGIGALFIALSRNISTVAAVSITHNRRPSNADLINYALIGAAALMLQVTWSRLYGMVLLRTEYVMAIILAVFLAGMAIGSAVSQWGKRSVWLNWLPLCVAAAAVISLISLPAISAWAETVAYGSLLEVLVKQGAMLTLVTFTVTFCLGAWLPLLVRAYPDAATAGAWFYGANAAGAGLGALLAGFILMPWIGSSATIIFAAVLLFVVGMRWCQWRPLWLVAAPLMGCFYIYAALPPVATLLPQAHANSHAKLYLHEDSVAITHVVETRQGQRLLLSDLQRMDASTEPTAVVAQYNQARLPLLLHPDAKKVLFLGLGTGISAAAALDFDARITAVELSQGAIDSARQWFAPVNREIVDHAEIIHDDARRYLMRSSEYYDVIIGDLFHPDLVGRSRLLSAQQFQRAKRRLANGGLYVQWLALNQFDLEALQIILNSFQQNFPQASLFIDGFRLAMVGGRDGPVNAGHLLANLEDKAFAVKTGGEGVWTWLGRYFGRINSPSDIIEDEWRPRIEYHLPRARYSGGIDLQQIIQWLLEQRPPPQAAAQQLAVDQPYQQRFERAYLSVDASMRSWQAQLNGDSERAQRFLQFAYQGNAKDQWVSGALADTMLASMSRSDLVAEAQLASLVRILEIKPDHLPTLEALFTLSQQLNNPQAAQRYLSQIRQVSPLYRATEFVAEINQQDLKQL